MIPGTSVVAGSWTQYAVQALEAAGVDVESLCPTIGLSYRALTDPTAWIEHARFARLWYKAVRASGDANLGLHAAECFQPAARDLLSHLLMSCETLGEGIERTTKLFELSGNLIGPRLIRRPRENVLYLENRETDHSAMVEFCLAVHGRLLETAAQQEIRLLEVRFRHPSRGAPEDLYMRVYGCPIRFSSAENCLVLSDQSLALPLPNASEQTARTLERAAALAIFDPAGSTLESQVRLIVRSQLAHGDHSESAVAAALNLSTRTLKRRLAKVQWSFGDLVDDVRRQVALDLLLSTSETLEKIAPEAGYASAGSLVRAVKRWTGSTPAAFRARSQAKRIPPLRE